MTYKEKSVAGNYEVLLHDVKKFVNKFTLKIHRVFHGKVVKSIRKLNAEQLGRNLQLRIT